MHRLANFDISRLARSPNGKVAAEIGFGLACATGMIAARSAVDSIAPTVGPFAMVYPAVLIATLYGHWRAGLVAAAVALFWAWYVVLPMQYSFGFAIPTDPARLALNAVCCLLILALAEVFRRAVAQTVAQRDAEITQRKIFHAELEHRTKNNFALVAALLEIQKRRETEPQTVAALEDAVGRVRTFAEAYDRISNIGEGQGGIAMSTFIPQVVERLGKAAFGSNIAIRSEIAEITLAREVAVAIGLYLNEALTNCAKYAFPEGRPGSIHVRLNPTSSGWQLTVNDDGVGESRKAPASAGIGGNLMRAFAQQARAEHSATLSDKGCHLELSC